MNLALIGYRGTGKSTIARIISKKTGLPLVNLDAAIVERAGMSIPEIVEKHGWDRFRELETETLLAVSSEDSRILDCGGGIILKPENREQLKASAKVVWLVAGIDAIIERIKGDDQRPSLTGKSFTEEVKEVLDQREPLYKESADYVVHTDAMSPEQAANEIISLAGLETI